MEHLFTTVISEFHLKRYLKFISAYKEKEHQDDIYCENHHILPKAYYPEFKKDKWNLVRLPYRAHYLAHYMLAKAIGGRMWFAFNVMNNRGSFKNINSHIYLKGKENFKIQKSIFDKSIDEETGLTNAKLGGRLASKTKTETFLENGLSIAQNAALKGAKIMSETILENGLSIRENATIIGLKTRTATILDNGLSIIQNASIKRLETMTTPNQETGLTIYQKSGIAGAKTRTETILENGLTISQNASKIMSKTRIDSGCAAGFKNPNALFIQIFDNTDNLLFQSFGDFTKLCKEQNLSYKIFRNSYINKTPIKNLKWKGFYAINLGFCKNFKEDNRFCHLFLLKV